MVASVAFFGVGNMGGPMALRLVNAGFKVWVFDLNEQLLQPLIAAGAIAGQPQASDWGDVDFVISMLPNGRAVESLYLEGQDSGTTENKGIFSQLRNHPLVIDCSTVGPETCRRLHHAAERQQLTCIDAPVSGGVAGALAGTLSFLCGGTEQDIERAKPVLMAMGKHVLHAGGTGAGAVAKICNNMLLAVQMIGTAEALALGVAHGLNPGTLSDILLKSSGRNWTLEVYNPWPDVMENAPASRGYCGGFAVNLMRKDLGLALAAAEHSHSSIPMGALARQIYALHSSSGHGLEDFSGVLQMFRPELTDQ